MRRIALAVGLALSAAIGAAPAEAKGPSPQIVRYELTQAHGVVRVTFRGDEAAGCRANGVCSLSGTTTYSYGGRPSEGDIVWAKVRNRTVAFYGFFETESETVSDVVTAGNDEHCVDRTEPTPYETIAFEPRSRTVRFKWRQIETFEDESFFVGGNANVFDTRCAGPELVDLAPSRALPSADLPYRIFRSPGKSTFRTTGTRPFAGGGFAGTVEWDLRYGMRRGAPGGRGFSAVPIG